MRLVGVACGVVVLAVILACGPPAAQNKGGGQQESKPKPPTREQLKAKLIGKTKAEVIELLGKPHKTEPHWRGGDEWLFREVSFDPVSDKVDSLTFVYFLDGERVAEIAHR